MNYIETIRIEDGIVRNMEYHRRRMAQTSDTEFPRIIVPREYSIGRVKCRIVYDAAVKDISFSHYALPVIKSLRVVNCDSIEYAKKYEDRTELQRLFAFRSAHDDVLIVKHGLLTDTSYCNIVLESDGRLFTPDTPLLPGTKRRYLLEQGRITERRISLSDLASYQKVFLINALIDLEDNISIPVDAIAL